MGKLSRGRLAIYKLLNGQSPADKEAMKKKANLEPDYVKDVARLLAAKQSKLVIPTDAEVHRARVSFEQWFLV
jgi:hypothetical protein